MRSIALTFLAAGALAAFALPALAGPCAPTVLTPAASATGLDPTTVSIEWSAPAGGCGTVSFYTIYFREDAAPTAADILTTTTQTSYTFPSDALEFESLYWYRVEATFADSTTDATNDRFFQTRASNDPIFIHYYWETQDIGNTTGVKTMAIEVVGPDNPTSPPPGIGIYNLIADHDQARMSYASLGSAPAARGPRLPMAPALGNADTTQNVQFFGFYAASDPPNPPQGFLGDVRFTLLAPIDPPELPVDLIDNTSGGPAVLSWRFGEEIPHTFVKSTFIPPPKASTLLVPADGATEVAALPSITWRRGYFNRSFDVYVWPASDPRPATPTLALANATTFEITRTLTVPLAPNTDYLWQVVSKNNTGTIDSAVFAFRTVTVATPTPSLTPSPSPSETETPTPSPSETQSPTPTVSPTASDAPTPSVSPSPSDTNAPTPTESATPTVEPTASPTEEPTVTPSSTPEVTGTVTPTQSATPTLATPPPTESPTPSLEPTPSQEPTPSATVSPSPSASPSPSDSPAPTDSATPSPTAAPNRQEIIDFLLALTNEVPTNGDQNGDGLIDGADVNER